MNIIFLTLVKIRDDRQTDVYSSLLREFTDAGHEVYIISPIERRDKMKNKSRQFGRLHLHFAEIGNYFNVGWVKKGISTIFLSGQYLNTIRRELDNISYDLILYSTPPITFAPVIKYLRKKNKSAVTYLMLKDIWPQSMADMGTLKNSGLQGIVYKYFQIQERWMYSLSDYIGCMSPACAKYVLRHNRNLNRKRVELCPNAVNFNDEWNQIKLSKAEAKAFREKYNVPVDKVVFVFGGNIGSGHDPDFLEECIKWNEKRTDSFILFVGEGIYYERIKTAINEIEAKNTKIIPYLPQDEYAKLLAACDVGIITLDHRFTCPNYPSRLMSYLADSKPVIIASDAVSDVGLIAKKNGYGYWCESNDIEKFISLMDYYMDESRRLEMGRKGYEYLKKHYNTKLVYKRIMSHIAYTVRL